MKKLFLSMVIGVFGFVSCLQAAEIKDQDKVKLQLALMDFIEINKQEDNAFVFFDAKQKQLVRLFPANLHPMIVPGDGFYFLCADFRLASGKKYDVDFVAVATQDEFQVVQTLLNQRDVVRAMMRAGK